VLPLNASRVRILDVSFNSLSSLHAGVFLGHPRLRSFSAESNLLAEKVPGSLSSCTEVQYLNMANNSLHGTLDLFNFARLTRLRALHIGWNQPVDGPHPREPVELPEQPHQCSPVILTTATDTSFLRHQRQQNERYSTGAPGAPGVSPPHRPHPDHQLPWRGDA
jgi:hypothetical protein